MKNILQIILIPLIILGCNQSPSRSGSTGSGAANLFPSEMVDFIPYEDNPIFDSCWVEEVCVLKSENTCYMFAEGRGDITHLLTSCDRIHWKGHGSLDVRYTSGEPLSEGPYGTPAVWLGDGTWYLFYERMDLGIWLAASTDLKIRTDLQDEPVIAPGPGSYDQKQVSLNQVIKYKGNYFAYYNAHII